MQRLLMVLVALLCVGCSFKRHAPDLVPTIDLKRYAGCWYEIATIPMFVQRDCVATTATYSLNTGGTLAVINRCRSGSFEGAVRTVEGTARVVNPAEPAKLEVSFNTWWGIFARGHYWVTMLDKDYRWAVVTGPNPERLWLLSRTPTIDTKLYERIVAQLYQRGYDLKDFQPTAQKVSDVACGKL